ncbi:MAG: hemerythrin domain-containing protein [Nanoarchaeota archaeon]
MVSLADIRQEHIKLLNHIGSLDAISSRTKHPLRETQFQMKNILNIWDTHEKKEEELFKNLPSKFPIKSMEMKHQLLRGHWKVLNLALQSHDEDIIKIALDTDGKMFSARLKEHILIEEKLFDKL